MIRYSFESKRELDKFIKQIKDEVAEAKVELPLESDKLAKSAGKWMARRVRIKTRREGATGELAVALENSVNFSRRGTGFTITVGDTGQLPKYWAMINYGGIIRLKAGKEGVPGEWLGGGGIGEFKYTPRHGRATKSAKNFLWLPLRPIKGFHYIAYAYVRMSAYVRERFRVNKKRRR